VKVSWNATPLEGSSTTIDSYWVLRSAPPNSVAEALARGAVLLDGSGAAPPPGRRAFLVSRTAAVDYAWEFIASSPAFHVPNYSYVAPTTDDSTAAGNPLTAFMIQARTPGGTQVWDSAPDSGYSVDNLPPAVPAPFFGTFSAGVTHLHWGVNHEPDFAGYLLYRGSTADFTPGPGNLIAAKPDTGYDDPSGAGNYYKLTALDIHGNQSAFALLTPENTLDVNETGVPTEVYLAPPGPNPASRAATIRFGLPREALVSLQILDVSGRLVRELAGTQVEAGAHTLTWDLRDQEGSGVSGGLFLVRLSAAGATRTARLVVVR
jgi:hypothetical protein